MARRNETSQQVVRGREREVQCLGLRKSGATYRQIGAALGISGCGAHKAVTRALERIKEQGTQEAREVKALELERLDDLLLGAWEKARTGEQRAIYAVLAIMERRSRLLGLDGPEKVEHTLDARIKHRGSVGITKELANEIRTELFGTSAK